MTAKNRAYGKIRNAIFGGKFPPGYQLKEDDLVAYCEVSRTPVRQAFKMLADEGLVTVKSNRRSYVADVSEAHSEEIYDILSMLESYSAGLAALRISHDELDNLRAILDEMEVITKSRPADGEGFLELNSRFHKAIHSASGNATLYEIIQRIVDFPATLYLKIGIATNNETAISDHASIVDALATGDRDYAALSMKMHTETTRREFRDLWKQESPG
jgi:GntR family transcriptional regulator, rspAB operon transcriptional repressor